MHFRRHIPPTSWILLLGISVLWFYSRSMTHLFVYVRFKKATPVTKFVRTGNGGQSSEPFLVRFRDKVYQCQQKTKSLRVATCFTTPIRQWAIPPECTSHHCVPHTLTLVRNHICKHVGLVPEFLGCLGRKWREAPRDGANENSNCGWVEAKSRPCRPE